MKAAKEGHKEAAKALKESKKSQQKGFKDEIKRLEKDIPNAEYEQKLLSNRGKLELIVADSEVLGTLKERWIFAEVAKRHDYSIFMAVSERGGKNNSGDYEHVLDVGGSLVEFPDGHPQEGQLVVDQDLVNYDLSQEQLNDAAALNEECICVAEAFVRFAQIHRFDFWRDAE